MLRDLEFLQGFDGQAATLRLVPSAKVLRGIKQLGCLFQTVGAFVVSPCSE
jgi:hypothetical protein